MDNDAKWKEVARNIVKGGLFRWKYRGVPILSAEAGNNLIGDWLREGRIFCMGQVRYRAVIIPQGGGRLDNHNASSNLQYF